MGDVVNLRAQRKRAEREQRAKRAAQRRAEHGASKAERLLTAARERRAERDLDLHRLDTGDDE
ncbi:MAG TPA: DUF4169 family protein [Xanthobacteraceae bacterium]|nr:DUF4169 family protein [Xanthobacteraceae bacterium]